MINSKQIESCVLQKSDKAFELQQTKRKRSQHKLPAPPRAPNPNPRASTHHPLNSTEELLNPHKRSWRAHQGRGSQAISARLKLRRGSPVDQLVLHVDGEAELLVEHGGACARTATVTLLLPRLRHPWSSSTLLFLLR